MPLDFDWEFEEESGAPRKRNRVTQAPGVVRRWLPRVAVLSLLVAVLGLAARAWVMGRLDAVKKAEANLKSVVNLELKTIADGDVELFRSLQNPNDPRWEAQQIARYHSTSGGFAPAPGLAPASRSPGVTEVTVLGRDGRADLTFWFNPRTDETDELLPFSVTWFYHQQDDGIWYHVSPPQDYRGVPYFWYGTYLTVRATEADAELLDPVARELIYLVFDGCQRLQCSPDASYTLSFDRELAPLVRGDEWMLPAPFLAGMPEGDAAHAAWERALELWVVEALARSQVGASDLGDRLIYRQLLVRLRKEIGLSSDSIAVVSAPDSELLAEILRTGRYHTLQSLWQAQKIPGNPEETLLMEHQTVALLEWTADQVGDDRILELLPMLGDRARFKDGLFHEYRLPPVDFDAEWFSYLFERAGITPVPASDAPRSAPAPQMPTRPSPGPLSSGEHIAFVCNNRIWVSDADGSGSRPLTSSQEGFHDLLWSPDGRRLLTTWVADPASALVGRDAKGGALFLLVTDRGGEWFVTGAPALDVQPIGWGPGGREVIYTVRPVADGRSGEPGVWATAVDSGRTRSLPSSPIWSPDGAHVAFSTSSVDSPMGTIWLAESNWQHVQQILNRGWIGSGDIWSPDGSKLALSVNRFDEDKAAIVIYDLESQELTLSVTAQTLTEALSSLSGAFLTDGVYPGLHSELALRDLWPMGWSADGSHLCVWAQASSEVSTSPNVNALILVPMDGSPPRVIARGGGAFVGDVLWSSTNPDLMAVIWPTPAGDAGSLSTYLFDLHAGPIFTATQTSDAAWSPDGAWLAVAGEGGVRIVDDRGKVRSILEEDSLCSDVAWNPTADLSALRRPIAVTTASAPVGWRFTNVRVNSDPFTRTAHVWGELVNETGDDQRIVAFVPVLRDQHRNIISTEQWQFVQGCRDMVTAVDLTDGGSLPFGLSVRLPRSVQLQEEAEIVVFVAAEPGKSLRTDLDIPSNHYDLSLRPEALRVSGSFENPGPDLTEYVTIVVTAFGVDDQVMGWGWQHATEPALLSTGTHPFGVQVEFSEPITDLDLPLGYYKIQVFGR